MRRLRSVLLLFMLVGVGILGGVATSHAASPVIVVHPDVAVDSIDREILARIFQGKHTRWEDGSGIVAVMLKDGPTFDMFVEDVIETTPSRFRTFWKQAVFSGRGIPPKSFDSEVDLVEFVAGTPGAIGFVSPLTPLRGVRSIRVE